MKLEINSQRKSIDFCEPFTIKNIKEVSKIINSFPEYKLFYRPNILTEIISDNKPIKENKFIINQDITLNDLLKDYNNFDISKNISALADKLNDYSESNLEFKSPYTSNLGGCDYDIEKPIIKSTNEKYTSFKITKDDNVLFYTSGTLDEVNKKLKDYYTKKACKAMKEAQ